MALHQILWMVEVACRFRIDHPVENLVDSLHLEDPAAQKNPAAAPENLPHFDYPERARPLTKQ